MPLISLLVAGSALAGGVWLSRRRRAAMGPPTPDDAVSGPDAEPDADEVPESVERDLALSVGNLALTDAAPSA